MGHLPPLYASQVHQRHATVHLIQLTDTIPPMTAAEKAAHSSDVLVIGGGFIGLATTLELAREKIKVTLLERGQLGAEASWAGAGLTKPCSWNRHDSMAQLLRQGIFLHPQKNAQLRDETGLDVEYTRCGRLQLLTTDQQLRMAQSEVRAAQGYANQYGSPLIEVLTPEQARRLEPNLTPDAPAVVRCHVTAQLRNPLMIRALRAACQRHGACLHEHQPVTELLRDGNRVVGARTATDHFRADRTVLAAGAWSAQLDHDVKQLAPVYPVRGQIVLLHQSPPPFQRVIERGPCYLIPRQDGHMLIGSTTEDDSGYDKSTTTEGLQALLTQAYSLVPALKQARRVRTWAGLRPGTPDHRPVIGTHESCPGLIFATGHFKTGICQMWITARAVRDLVVGGQTSLNLERCLPGRDFTNPKTRPRHNPTGTTSGASPDPPS